MIPGSLIKGLLGVLLFVSVHTLTADSLYVIRKNDTLSRIARAHGVSVKELARYNGITKTDLIHEGQRLRIPGPETTPYAGVLSSDVEKAIKSAKVRKNRWQSIVIHHSATSQGSARGMDEYHRETRHMENGLAYHFVIGNGKGMKDGEIAVARRWDLQLDGGHLASQSLNRVSIGICLVGHFDKTPPTKAQLQSLKALLHSLMKRCQLSLEDITTHQEINTVYTRCPGRRFPTKTLMNDLRAQR